MSKRDDLILKMTKLQQEVGVDFGKAACFDMIYDNDALLLYKYVELLQLNDLKRNLQGFNNYKNQIDALEGKENLSEKEEKLLEFKDEVNDKIGSYTEKLQEETFKYRCDGEYSSIACNPIDAEFEQLMLNHKRDLEGIYDVNETSVKTYSDMINKSVLQIDEENEEVDLSVSEIERRNKEAIENDVMLPSLDAPNMLSYEESIQRLNELKMAKDENERSQDENELLEQIEDLIEDGHLDDANRLMDTYEEALISTVGEINVDEEVANKDEVERQSDHFIEDAVARNIEAVLADNENEAGSELDDGSLGF